MTTLEEIEASLEPDSLAFYSVGCAWWATDPRDLGETGGDVSLPCCPYCGSVLMQAPAQDFIAIARSNTGHYGEGRLTTFARAHHSNGLHAASWDNMLKQPIRFQQRPPSTEKSMRCVVCATEYSEAETVGIKACPMCDHGGVPMAIDQDCTVRVNWHELRILGIWAENWARQVDQDQQAEASDLGLVVSAIARRLEAQHPDYAPLTLTGEMRQMQEQFPSAELRTEDGEVIVPKREEEEPS